MLVKCPVCGAHVLRQTAVEVPVGGEIHRFCSARCAESEEAGEARSAPLAPLPPPPLRILVAVDGSGPSLRAVEMAAMLARLAGSELLLLNAMESGWLHGVSFGAPAAAGAVRLGLRSDEVARALRAGAEAHLDRARRICDQAGVKCSSRAEFKSPLKAIVDGAEEADLIVMGSRGLGALSGAIRGSLSQRVIGATDTPVLVVH